MDSISLRDATMLAKDFVLGIYRQDLLPERRTALVIGALESLAKREKGVEAIVAMRQVLPLVFALNVVAAQDASGIIESWLANSRCRIVR
jgi:hypothetical protein